MELYFAPGACSLAPHIVAHEAGIPVTPVRVDLRAKTLPDGGSFLAINSKGYVPALQLDSGDVLTEGPAIVQYLADQKPAAGLAPANGSMARYRLQEWLNFISTEIHKQFSPLFNAANPDSVKEAQKAKLAQRFGEIAPVLEKQDYLTGNQFSVADAYLFTVLGWSKYFHIDLNQWPSIARFVDRVAARPAVAEALEVEAKAKKLA